MASASVAVEKPRPEVEREIEPEEEKEQIWQDEFGHSLSCRSRHLGRSDTRMSVLGMEDAAAGMEDNMAAALAQEERTIMMAGAQDVAFDGSGRKEQKLASFEDRMDRIAAEATGVDDNISDDSEDSDQERLTLCAQAFREGQKKMVNDPKIKEHEDGSAQEKVADALKDQMDAMKKSGLLPTKGGQKKGDAAKDAGASLQRGASSASGLSSAASATSGGVSMGARMSSESIDLATDSRPMLMTMGTSMSLVSDGGASAADITEQKTVAGMPGVGGEEEEEEDADEDPDNADVIDTKYKKRYKMGLPEKVEQIRHLCIKMGDEEPPVVEHRSTVATKSRVLEVLFISRGDYDSEKKFFTFRRKPIGIMWNKRAPISIHKVKERSHGDELGVTQGMEIQEINGTDVTKLDYAHQYAMLMKAVNHLPDQAPPVEDAKARLNAGMEGQVLTVRGRVTIEAARGFQNELAKHFIVCNVAGKPHSKVQTAPQSVEDTPETADLVWNQVFDLFDYQHGDTIEFACYAQEEVASKTGEDTSLGRARLTWEAASKGFHGELSLLDPHSRQMAKTKMTVKVEVDMVPEKQQAISAFRHIMREKMLTLGVKATELKASFPENESATTFTTASDAVRDALRGYHKHSEALGIFMPFPGMKENEGYAELEPDANKKLLEYNRKLNEDDPNRLWVAEKADEQAASGEKGLRASMGSAESGNWQAANTAVTTRSRISGFMHMPHGHMHMPHMTTGSTHHEAAADRTDPITELEIVFEVDAKSKEEQAIFFEHPTIGIEFTQRMPITVKAFKANSVAEQKGVQKGWKIKRVGGKDLSKMWYKEASKVLSSNLDRLPKE